jgi:hypothetical protein
MANDLNPMTADAIRATGGLILDAVVICVLGLLIWSGKVDAAIGIPLIAAMAGARITQRSGNGNRIGEGGSNSIVAGLTVATMGWLVGPWRKG